METYVTYADSLELLYLDIKKFLDEPVCTRQMVGKGTFSNVYGWKKTHEVIVTWIYYGTPCHLMWRAHVYYVIVSEPPELK